MLPLATAVTTVTHSSIIAGLHPEKWNISVLRCRFHLTIMQIKRSEPWTLLCHIHWCVHWWYERVTGSICMFTVCAWKLDCITDATRDEVLKKKNQRNAYAWEFKKDEAKNKNKHQPPHLIFLFVYSVHHFWKTLFHTWSFFHYGFLRWWFMKELLSNFRSRHLDTILCVVVGGYCQRSLLPQLLYN